MRNRSIIHLNFTDFAVAVERLQDRSLRRVPVIVAPVAAARTLVHDMSEEAYLDGVRKGMPLERARRYCRRARIVAPQPLLYRRVMRAVAQRAATYTPLVEPGPDDGHLFLDVSGSSRLFGPARDIAHHLRRRLLRDLELEPIWTLATNKLVAKAASRLVRPLGEYIVDPGDERAFLAPLPLGLLPGLRDNEIRRLAEFNLERIGQLAQLSRGQLRIIFQRRADFLYCAGRGLDETPVQPEKGADNRIIRSHRFHTDTDDPAALRAVLCRQVHDIGALLRQRQQLSRRVGVRLIHCDGRSITRQATVKNGTDNDFVLRRLAATALTRALRRRIRIRCCILICDRLLPRSPQQTLFRLTSDKQRREQKILRAMDLVRRRYGGDAIGLGSAGTTGVS